MDTKTLATLVVTITLAFIGYLVTYFNSLRLAQRKERADRIDRQLRDLYGPLFSLVSSSQASWKVFHDLHWPQQDIEHRTSVDRERVAATWRLWIKAVFMPYNEAMAKLVADHSDLLNEDQIPQCLIDLCTHVACYRAVLQSWDEGDYSQLTSIIDFPGEAVLTYAQTNFLQLKHQQSLLLGRPAAPDNRSVPSMEVIGPAGTGKTHSTMDALTKLDFGNSRAVIVGTIKCGKSSLLSELALDPSIVENTSVISQIPPNSAEDAKL
jgi:hypothetical protein